MSRRAWMLALTLISASAWAEEQAVKPEAPAPGPRPALMAAKAAQARLMDITMAGGQLVAVGEEGVILTSADGTQWTQSPSPVNTTLYPR